ncbi:MAG TPA: selenocysteine-specific translation elongation factor [Caulobacteraceae bacterium]
MIVATAGHVDHGKTSLIKRLTGVDTDRLAEEKARGMTIDLGFAYTPLASGKVLGFVDVPGHERFVTNMLAGVGAIDHVLLVVAADDGPMPQTEEHLGILDLLGIPAGVIVITKTDRVSPERLAETRALVAARVRGTFLQDAEVFCVSNITGAGVDALRDHLHALAEAAQRTRSRGTFRLAVDRRFTIDGAGLVVTGSVLSGAVAIGDQLVLSPAGLPVRVRGLHAQNRPAKLGGVGERLALNLTGMDLKKGAVSRGDWIVGREAHNPSIRLDARIRVLAGEDRPLRHRQPVHLHIGAADVTGRVAVLQGRAIEPGAEALVQIVLDRPVIAAHGDRFVLRDQSAQRTLAGGVVIEPFGAERGRSRPERIALLQALDGHGAGAALTQALAVTEGGIDAAWFAAALNLTPAEADALWARADLVRVGGGAETFVVTRAQWDALKRQAADAVAAWHEARPDSPAATSSDVRRSLGRWMRPQILSAALASLVEDRELRREGQGYARPDHRVARPAERDALERRILPLLDTPGAPPNANEIADKLGLAPRQVRGCLVAAARRGAVRQISETRFFLPQAVAQLARAAEALSAARPGGWFRVTDFRDHTGIGRNPGIELLEYFDHRGFTLRVEHDRRTVGSAAAFDV